MLSRWRRTIEAMPQSQPTIRNPGRGAGDALAAGLVSAVTGGVPSTAWALMTGRDVLASTRAVGAMLVDPQSGDLRLYAAALCGHLAISLLWAAVLATLLPRRRTIAWAVAAAVVIAVLDLRIMGRLFPEIYALAFWPQLADHVAWGATVGVVVALRRRAGT